ncbi:zinc-binding alcohol dehydrogenase family protein [Williamsia muralis]|uniref:Zinc-type alcohol dehydrogenase-like protein n=1 Tax=Williamsia marianensis TaxID=85044 RepID=A0A2G3PK92_WILMA|nr:zinc-binding alcohol dehydrogenase family protein [Williamsia marianensis]PHV66143.1 NADPH:quinone reductase [Williamsia marianensis]
MTIPTTTTTVAALEAGPVDAPDSFVEIELPVGEINGRDLLVEVKAVSVNPVDVKQRSGFQPQKEPKVLGYDAAGTVIAVGSDVELFAVGDDVFYAGSIGRSGSNTQFHVVDERMAGRKPVSLPFGDAAALPLTSITAWEALFTEMGLKTASTGTLLVMGGAGGVGSVMIQLARALTGVTVIATASRPESMEWARDLGAHHVINHHNLAEEATDVAPQGINWIFSPFSAGNVETYAQIMAVRGAVIAIDEPAGLDILPLKSKSQSWQWELMFTVPLYEPESDSQHHVLNRISDLVDRGVLKTTVSRRLTPINAENLREAHRAVEGGSMIGKVIVSTD